MCMNSEYINPFIQGAQNVLNMVCGDSPKLGNIFLKKAPPACEAVSIIIGIMGDIQGCVIYTVKEASACRIASKMMFGMPISQLDEMSISALGELGNMISGNVATLFAGKGVSVDITPPNCKLNASEEELRIMPDGSMVFCVPLTLQNGDEFEVDIFIKE